MGGWQGNLLAMMTGGRITLAWVGVDIQFGQCLSVLGEELDFSDFDGSGNPSVRELAELSVGFEPWLELLYTLSPYEAADSLPATGEGEFRVGTMPLGVFGVHAFASRVSTDLILHRDATGMHRTDLH